MEENHPFIEFLELDFKTSDGTISEMLEDAMIQAWNAACKHFEDGYDCCSNMAEKLKYEKEEKNGTDS